jgi:hypothetical protein
MSFIINPYSFGFNPLSLSPALWLSDTGSDPATWPDLSGNGRNATQATSANQPSIVAGGLNGRQIRRFDGSNDILISSLNSSTVLSGNLSYFAVFKRTSTGSFPIVMGVAAAGNGRSRDIFLMSSDLYKISYGQSGSDVLGTFPAAINTAALVSLTKTGTSIAIFANGSAAGSGTPPLTNTVTETNFKIGGASASSGNLSGDIAELLVFPTALSTTNRQAVESYLRTKWGTP